MFELMEMNIYELIRGRRQYLAEKNVKLYMYQLLKAMDHMHKNGVFHRDIKPENIHSSLLLSFSSLFFKSRSFFSGYPPSLFFFFV